MALDGLFLHYIRLEIERAAELGARVDRIVQPSRDVLILHLRWRGGAGKLLLCGGASSPRIHFTRQAPENPKTPPMFCMLLRKHLSGARLVAARQTGLDRVLHLEFEALDELGDLAVFTIAVEIMGRHSNVIVIDAGGKILDSLRRVDFNTSRVRQVLPGMRYELPPGQNKANILRDDLAGVVSELRAGRDVELSKALMERLEGFSPLVCREVAAYVTRGVEITAGELSDEQAGRLAFYLGALADNLRRDMPSPVMVLEPDGRPRDFSCVPVRQYGTAMLTREYPGCSELLEAFFADRDRLERVRQRSGDLLSLLANTSDRILRRLANQRQELETCAEREQLKRKGDLISANLYAIKKGDEHAVVQDFYDPDGAETVVELDPMLTPSQNAQHYYALYRKADTAEKHLGRLIAQGEEELAYVDSVFDALTRADGESELDAIRRELADSGYVRRAATGRKGSREQKLPPLRYLSSDGFAILCGRNNLQNDQLTLREASKQDLWLHTQKIPGAHVIVLARGKPIPDATVEQAAVIAAYNSRGRDSSRVPVDYTAVKNVKKPAGARPGMVIYETYRTLLVDPDGDLVQSLTADK